MFTLRLAAAIGILVVLVSAPGIAATMPTHCGLYAYKADVTEVYDGDTITADVDLGFNTWRRGEKLRLAGINAPEVRGEEREAGLISRDALRSRVLGKQVIICTIKDKTGKFGRYLAEIYLDGENINEWMMLKGHAAPYDGGRRADVFSWDAFFGTRYERAPLPPPGE